MIGLAGFGATAASLSAFDTEPAAAATCFTAGALTGFPYVVPPQVTQVQVTLYGNQGGEWIGLDGNGDVIADNPGGAGSTLTVNVPVTPGSTIEEGTLAGGTGGSSDDASGVYYQEGLNGPYSEFPDPGSDGGAAQFVEVVGSCPQVLASAGGGGGGGALIGGGAGGSADLGLGGGAGGNGGSNDSVDGAGGGGGTSSGGGGGGAAGYDSLSSCANGNDGQGGGIGSGGNGGDGSSNNVTPSGVVICNGGSGGGGGGAGYYFGGGGGSGWDDDPSGGGGGAGTYVAPGSSVVSLSPFILTYLGFPGPTMTPIFNTTTTLTTSANPSPQGQPLTLTATVSQAGNGSAGAGSVTFFDGSTNLGTATVAAGLASLTNATLAQGDHTLSATYSGGSNPTEIDLASNSASYAQTISLAYSVPIIRNEPSSISTIVGDDVTFTAIGYANPDPTVQWEVSTDGGSTWSNIAGATAATTGLAQGSSTPTGRQTSTSYSLTVAQSDFNNQYRAVFSNVEGSTPTSAAVLRFLDATSIGITPTIPTLDLGATEQLAATATYQTSETADVTNQVVWSSDNPGAFTVSSTGLLTAVGTAGDGVAGITASLTNADGIVSVSNAYSVSVSLASPTSITVTPTDPTVAAGGQEQFTATGHYAGGYTADITDIVFWSASDSSIVAGGTDGLFSVSSGAGANSYTIKAVSTYGTVEGSTVITTLAGTPVSLALTPSTADGPVIGLGQTVQMTATATYADGSTADVTSSVAWFANDPSVVSVSSTGLATGVSTTTDNIVAGVYALYTAPNGEQVQANTQLTETLDHPLSIAVTPANPSMARGASQQFTATGSYPNGYSANISSFAIWQSSNGGAVIAQSDGEITALSTAGGQSATIYALSPDGTVVGSTTVSVLLGDPVSVSITIPKYSLGLGQTEQLTATAIYQNGSTADVTASVTWSSGSPGVASVTSTGLVTGLSIYGPEGATALMNATYTAPDGLILEASNANTTITVNENNAPVSIAVTPVNSSILPGGGQQFSATGTYAAGVTADITSIVNWSSSSAQLVSDGGGYFASTVTGVGGSATVTATFPHSAVAGSVGVALDSVVTLAGPSTDSTYAGPGYQSATFTTSGGSGGYAWSLQNAPSGITLSSTSGASSTLIGTPTTANGSPIQIEVDVSDTSQPGDYAFIDFQLTVLGQPQTININNPPTAGVTGTQVTLSATGGGSANPVVFSVDFTSSSGACAASGVNGTTLSFNGAGTCVVDANQAGTSTYAAATRVQLHISVLHSQIISWTSSPPAGAVVANSYTPSLQKGASGNPIVLSVDAATTNAACSVVGGTVHFDHVGTCVVDANQAGGGAYAPAPQIQQAISVGQAAQNLTFTGAAPTAARVGGPTYTPTFTQGTSGIPVVLSVDNETTNASCSVSGGTVSFDHVGTCVIDADQAGNADYAAAPSVQRSFAVAVGTQTIAFTTLPPSTVEPGDAFPIAYTGGTSGYYVFLTTDPALDPSFNCFVNSGFVYFESPGTCVIDANQQGDADYAAAPQVQLTFTVRVINTAITSPPFSVTASNDPTTPFTVSLTDGSGHLTTSDSDTTIFLGSSSPGAVFAATSGGASITSVVIPEGASSVTAYYADSQAGTPDIGAAPDGYFADSDQIETVNTGPTAVVSFVQGPSSSAVNTPMSPTVQVSVTDQFGNAETGVVTTLSTDHGGIAADSSETTDVTGTASFFGLTISDPGAYTLTASTGGISSPASASFEIVPPITVSGVSPFHGDPGGGTSVTVSGSGFTGATEVMFGSTAAESYLVDSDSEITATSPPGTSGWVDVTVANVGTQSSTSPADLFLYSGGPATISSVSPPRCSILGGCAVVITGYNFTSATAVSFGSTPATSFAIVNFTTIEAVVPAHVVGAVWVHVNTPSGTNANGFFHNYFVFRLPPPQITHINASHCSALGGCTVVITGQYFNGTTSVRFGATATSSFTIVNGSTIDAVVPAHPVGLVWVHVSTPSGQNPNDFWENVFGYRVPPPSITSLSIHRCNPSGGCSLVITGSYFSGATLARFGTTSAAGFVVVSDDEIDVTVPGRAAGAVWVSVTTPTGTNTNSFWHNYFTFR